MNILYIITKSEIGGAQMHVRQLIGRMKERGHIVGLTAYPGGWLEEEAKKLGVEFFPNTYFGNSYNPIRLLRAIGELRKVLRSFRPAIVHCHSSAGGFLGRFAVRGSIPTIFTAHSWAFTDGAPFLRKIIAIIAEKIVAPFASKIICVSEYDRRLARRYRIAPASKLITIHNGVVIGAPKNRNNALVEIVSVGRLAYPKEYAVLLDAFQSVPKDIQVKAKLTIIGDGPEKERLMRRVSANTFVGMKLPGEVTSILQSSDVFILLSKHEGFPMTILEAMSAGLPVIASRVGGIPEQVDAASGILVENKKEIVAAALTTLIQDTEKRTMMGSSAYTRAKKYFSLEQFLNTTEAVYESLLGK